MDIYVNRKNGNINVSIDQFENNFQKCTNTCDTNYIKHVNRLDYLVSKIDDGISNIKGSIKNIKKRFETFEDRLGKHKKLYNDCYQLTQEGTRFSENLKWLSEKVDNALNAHEAHLASTERFINEMCPKTYKCLYEDD